MKFSRVKQCAKLIRIYNNNLSSFVRDLSAIAIVNGRQWDMHRPLTENCLLKFVNFQQADPRLANKAYWRSCCFILGMIAARAFKDEHYVELHSWPSPSVESGSFVYDIRLSIDNWKPTKQELRVLSEVINKQKNKGLKFERLDVSAEFALKLFRHNRFKTEQIPGIAARSFDSKNTVTLYRLGDHVDISRGPMISSTSQIGAFDVTAVYAVDTDYGVLHRFQGVSLPSQIHLDAFPYNILKDRAAKVNPARLPTKDEPGDKVFETPLHRSLRSTAKSPTVQQ